LSAGDAGANFRGFQTLCAPRYPFANLPAADCQIRIGIESLVFPLLSTSTLRSPSPCCSRLSSCRVGVRALDPYGSMLVEPTERAGWSYSRALVAPPGLSPFVDSAGRNLRRRNDRPPNGRGLTSSTTQWPTETDVGPQSTSSEDAGFRSMAAAFMARSSRNHALGAARRRHTQRWLQKATGAGRSAGLQLRSRWGSESSAGPACAARHTGDCLMPSPSQGAHRDCLRGYQPRAFPGFPPSGFLHHALNGLACSAGFRIVCNLPSSHNSRCHRSPYWPDKWLACNRAVVITIFSSIAIAILTQI
jgi:hypothetical protein